MKRYRLADLLTALSPDREPEVDFGAPVGREFGAGDGGGGGVDASDGPSIARPRPSGPP